MKLARKLTKEEFPDKTTYCPNCGYSATPTVYYSERKHGDFYRVECSRCLYSSESKNKLNDILIGWANYLKV